MEFGTLPSITTGDCRPGDGPRDRPGDGPGDGPGDEQRDIGDSTMGDETTGPGDGTMGPGDGQRAMGYSTTGDGTTGPGDGTTGQQETRPMTEIQH